MVKFRRRSVFLIFSLLFVANQSRNSVLVQASDVNKCANLSSATPLLQHVPVLMKNAGDFGTFPNVSNLQNCMQLCCSQANCNVAFWFNQSTCFTIACRNESACKPVKSTNEIHKFSQMVILREISSKSWKTFGDPCDSASVSDCAEDFICLKDTNNISKSYCACKTGTFWDNSLKTCQGIFFLFYRNFFDNKFENFSENSLKTCQDVFC